MTSGRLNLDVFVSALFDKTRFVPGTGTDTFPDLKILISFLGLYELRHKYVWLKQAVFSLLKGRPLVIMANGANEEYETKAEERNN